MIFFAGLIHVFNKFVLLIIKHMKLHPSIIQFVENNNLVGLKAGNDRPDFLEIWMVVVRGRVFARSWAMSERGWYTAFLKNKNGFIKCGEIVSTIYGIVPGDIAELGKEINNAYISKYNYGSNSVYVQEIIEENRMEKTMEFIPVNPNL